jgi:hypothetical protein
MSDNRLPYYLTAHSYCCEVEDGAIILELITGSYIGVDAAYLPDLRSFIPDWPEARAAGRALPRACKSSVDALIANLLARGILATRPSLRRTSRASTLVTDLRNTCVSGTQPRTPMRQLVHFLIALVHAKARTKDKALASLLEWFYRRQQLIPHSDVSVALQKVTMPLAAFLRLRIWWYTAANHCLFDSLVLAIFLTRQRIRCSFVIGVSTKPFIAHAWVQLGAFVLNDSVEHIQMFTPILTIGND